MSLPNDFQIPYGVTYDPAQRVIMNSMVMDLWGNLLVFADLNPIAIAAIKERMGLTRVVFVAGEYALYCATRDGNKVKLQMSPDIHPRNIPTAAQQKALEDLAAVDLTDLESVSDDFISESKGLLPVLYYSDIAITPEIINFRGANYLNMYKRALQHIAEEINGVIQQGHRDFTVTVRTHLSELGADMSDVPKPELDDQIAAQQVDEIFGELAPMFASAQTNQVIDLPDLAFAVTSAKALVLG